MTNHSKIDQRLTELAKAARLTWGELAESAGISYNGLRKLRRGEFRPRQAVRERLALALNVDQAEIDVLFDADDDDIPEPEEVTFGDLALARPEDLHVHRLATAATGTVTGLLVDLPAHILIQLTEAEVVAVQAKLADYAVFVASQAIQERL